MNTKVEYTQTSIKYDRMMGESPQDIKRNSIKALYAVKAVIKRNI